MTTTARCTKLCTGEPVRPIQLYRFALITKRNRPHRPHLPRCMICIASRCASDAREGRRHGAAGSGLLAPVPGVAGARWAQDGDSVTVELMVPPGTRAADVACVIGAARLDAGLKGAPATLAGALGGRVSRDDSSWSLCDDAGQRMLVISLAKDGGDAKKWAKLLA